jgi:glycine/D-amino acid oxidase-like deaminating enzyme
MSGPSPDVVVIGGGIVGVSASAFLAEAGMRVVLIEQEAIGAAASGRNSGVVQHPFDPVLATLYRETLSLYRTLAEEAHGFALPAEAAGLLLISTDMAATKRLATDLTGAVPHMAPSLFEDLDLRRLEPTLAPGLAAVRINIGYPVAPGSAVRAFAEVAERHGSQFAIGAAGALVLDGDRVRGVRVGEDEIEASAVVVTGGPWTPSIIDPTGRWSPIVRSWGVIAELALDDAPRHVLEEAEIDAAIEPPDDGDDVDLSGVAFSLVTAAGRSALGSTFLDTSPDAEDYIPALIEKGQRFVPGIATATVLGSRACARPVSRDGRPLVGRLPWLRGAYIAAGHGPWGISTGPATGRLIADLVLGLEPTIPPALDPARFGSP